MITNNSSEHFFSSVVKRVLVALLCVPFVASSGLPVAFAAEHAPTKKRITTTSSKKRVALASRDDGSIHTNTESPSSLNSGAAISTGVPLTAPSWSDLPAKPRSSRMVVIGNAKNSFVIKSTVPKTDSSADKYIEEDISATTDTTVAKSVAKAADATVEVMTDVIPTSTSKTEPAFSATTIKSDAKVVDASADVKADVTPGEIGAVKTDPTSKTEAATTEAAAVKTDPAAADTATAKTDTTAADTATAKTNTTVADTATAKTNTTVADTATSMTNTTTVDTATVKAVTTTATAALKTDATATETAAVKTDTAVVKTDGTSADTAAVINGASDSAKLAAVPILGQVSTNEPIVIDNDEAVEVESSIKYEELPTDEGKTRVKTGAKFPVVISSQITTKTAKKGDPVEARLKYDLKIGDRLIAKKGAVVNGHINYSLPARSAMHSLVSATRWYRNSGCVGISFDEIINDKGEHLPLVAVPARAARIVKNKGEGRELGINHDGQVVGPLSQQLRYKALRIGLNAAMAPAGAFSFGAMPIALGVLGAANPSFAFMKPIGLNVRHRRIKGFFWGALSGVPGSWLIEDTVIKGQEAVIKPGDEFLAEFQQEFTGEPASEASMMPNANTKVHGQVMPVNNDKKHKNKN